MEKLISNVRPILLMEIAITKMSSKGQIIIPVEMRKGIEKGDKIIVIQNDKQIILEKADKLSEALVEDLEFAKKTKEAIKRMKAGKGHRMDFDDFIKEMKTW